MSQIASIEIDRHSLAALRSLFNAKQVSKIVYSAVKRTTAQAKNIAAKAVMERLDVPRRYIDGKGHRRAAISSKMQGGEIPVGVLTIKRVAIPLSAFKHRVSKNGGVTVTIDKSKGPETFRHAFAANVKSRAQDTQNVLHKGLFLRKNRLETTREVKFTPAGYAWRLPIKEMFGKSVLDFIAIPEIESRVIRDIRGVLSKNIDSQISRFTGGQFRSLAAAIAANQIAAISDQPEQPEDEFGGAGQ